MQPTKKPDYDKEVLEPLHAAQIARQAALEAAQQAEAARQAEIAAEAQKAARISYVVYNGNGYDYGSCAWYVASQRDIPGNWGNARDWSINAQAQGFSTGFVPRIGAIAHTAAGSLGHVALVIGIDGPNVLVREMNSIAGWNQIDDRWVPANSFDYIY